MNAIRHILLGCKHCRNGKHAAKEAEVGLTPQNHANKIFNQENLCYGITESCGIITVSVNSHTETSMFDKTAFTFSCQYVRVPTDIGQETKGL